MIASFLLERHITWNEKLPELVFALNTAVQSSTSISPAIINYGRQPAELGSQRRHQEVAVQEQLQNESLANWHTRLQSLPVLHEKAAARSQAPQARQASYYDARRRDTPFPTGNKVWKKIISSRRLRRESQPNWRRNTRARTGY